jgi:hypothetical protein
MSGVRNASKQKYLEKYRVRYYKTKQYNKMLCNTTRNVKYSTGEARESIIGATRIIVTGEGGNGSVITASQYWARFANNTIAQTIITGIPKR